MWSLQPRGHLAGLPTVAWETATCSTCFIWSRSGIGNSFNRNLAPHSGTDAMKVTV
jgi:hypothetical protein